MSCFVECKNKKIKGDIVMARTIGEGEIRQRKDKNWSWQSTLTLPTGEKKRFSIVRKERQDVVTERNRILVEIAQGKAVAKSGIKLSEWIDKWLNDYKKGNIEPTTWDTYNTLFKRHIKPNLGDIQLQKLITNDIQKFVAKLGKKYSTSTIKQIHHIISSAIGQAIKEGHVAVNVADHVVLPKTKTKKIKPLSGEDLQKLVNAANGDRLYNALLLMIEVGLRRGELLGLKWDCFNYKEKTIRIEIQITKLPSSGKTIEKPLKTTSSNRTIPISDEIADRLNQMEHTCDFIFCTCKGTPINPRNWNRSFDRWCTKANIDFRSHDLRHTFVTDLINSGVDIKSLQSFTGHANTRILLDNYAHVVTETQRMEIKKRKLNLQHEE
jgi:integrase